MVNCSGRRQIVFVSAPRASTEILREMHPWMKSRIKRRSHRKLLPSVQTRCNSFFQRPRLAQWKSISGVSSQLRGQKLDRKMRPVLVLTHAKWASLILPQPHACQQLIRRGTQKPVDCHELAYPLEAVRKSKVINQVRQRRGALAVVMWCAPHLACPSILRAALKC